MTNRDFSCGGGVQYQARILSYLRENIETTVRQITTELRLECSGVLQSLEWLERRGLIKNSGGKIIYLGD